MNGDLYIIKNGGKTGFGTSHTFNKVSTGYFTFSGTDSRGFTGRTILEIPTITYIPLTNNIEFSRPDAKGNVTLTCSGRYWNKSFGAVSNTLEVYYRYMDSNGNRETEWIPFSNITKYTNYTYRAEASFSIDNFDQNKSYVFETKAIDKLEEVYSESDPVKSTPIFHWGENDFAFEVPVNIKGDLRLKGDKDYGNTLRFGDGDNCYIAEPTDDDMVIHAKGKILFDANGVYVCDENNPLPTISKGVWTPTLYCTSGISSYTTQYGWYEKVGQCVTIGFFIKAICTSGYHNTNQVIITGNPFYPMFAAAGGGMCSGAYVSGGKTFQCFVAETDKTITTRVQDCYNDSPANLTTSKSGCYFRKDGGEITLSGTISYIATT
jgi:hypothetical protein